MANRRRRSERGAAFVEFVLVVPFLLGVIFLIVSFGVMLSFRQTLSQAAAEGARAAAVAPANLDYAARRDRAFEAINEAFLGQPGPVVACGTTLTCTIPETPATCGDANKCISVRLQYGYRAKPRVAVPQVFGVLLPATLTYTASARIS